MGCLLLGACADVTSCDAFGGREAFAVFKADEESDHSVTFTCARGQQNLLPSLTSQSAATGVGCRSIAKLTDIAEGASLVKTGTADGRETYKLTLKSLPKSPRLFCFTCVPAGTPGGPPCFVSLYAPAAKKKAKDTTEHQHPDPKRQIPDPKRGEETLNVVVSTTTKPTSNNSSERRPSWSSHMLYTAVLSALSAGIGNLLSV